MIMTPATFLVIYFIGILLCLFGRLIYWFFYSSEEEDLVQAEIMSAICAWPIIPVFFIVFMAIAMVGAAIVIGYHELKKLRNKRFNNDKNSVEKI